MFLMLTETTEITFQMNLRARKKKKKRKLHDFKMQISAAFNEKPEIYWQLNAFNLVGK